MDWTILRDTSLTVLIVVGVGFGCWQIGRAIGKGVGWLGPNVITPFTQRLIAYIDSVVQTNEETAELCKRTCGAVECVQKIVEDQRLTTEKVLEALNRLNERIDKLSTKEKDHEPS